MAASITDKDLGYKQLAKSIGALGSPGVLVGVPEAAGQDDDGTPLALIAAVNEFGSPIGVFGPGKRIPERSFLRSTVDEQRTPIATQIAKGVGLHLDGKTDIRKSLGRLGDFMVGKIQAKIDSNIPPANAQSTIDQKGEGKKTLQDEGRLKQSITREVVEAGVPIEIVGGVL